MEAKINDNELILRKADTEFTWAPVSNKVLVMIGNANPHPPDYKLNMDIILTGG